ncbi:hypothetical protein FD13_GL000311 [Levilactobacillus senmaizukei DSM 21775 = NBRC 103853]|uniref:Uncharacterized protein n=1 Tax=Levilactobacillus senmaizukei DSM 21775 = NBRC 103853 TaxID=1423803 RepID=A0A0R2DGN8_9LACO|nr:hypothetical protein [Levilactobacillus senmaizukei]KRN02171.1 hypothetical protein FD13_GL000311 [Levilactobacillus senmaizukei DSM 21775 = NBRC 103853]
MSLVLNIYKKGDTKPSFTGTDVDGVTITSLAARTVVVKGEYQASHTDSEGILEESDKVDVPAFTVNKAKAPAPTGVAAAPTDDGAQVTVTTA